MTALATRMAVGRNGRLAVDHASRWVVQRHHPDWLRTPEPRVGRIQADRMRAALAWNTFRTLALIEPSFWLRQLHARLFGFDERYRAPRSLDVRLWHSAAAAGRIEDRSDIVDVALESDWAVWGFLTAFERDVIATARDVEGPDPVLRTIDAVARFAEHRCCFVGMISSSERTAPIGAGLIRRYAEEWLQGRLRQRTRGHNVLGMGMGTWRTVAAVLADAAQMPPVDRPERLALRRCLRWLAVNGIRPEKA
jgi:hypothetical protein